MVVPVGGGGTGTSIRHAYPVDTGSSGGSGTSVDATIVNPLPLPVDVQNASPLPVDVQNASPLPVDVQNASPLPVNVQNTAPFDVYVKNSSGAAVPVSITSTSTSFQVNPGATPLNVITASSPYYYQGDYTRTVDVPLATGYRDVCEIFSTCPRGVSPEPIWIRMQRTDSYGGIVLIKAKAKWDRYSATYEDALISVTQLVDNDLYYMNINPPDGKLTSFIVLCLAAGIDTYIDTHCFYSLKIRIEISPVALPSGNPNVVVAVGGGLGYLQVNPL